MPMSPHHNVDAEAPGRANVATYDDWFPDLSIQIAAVQQGGTPSL